MPPTPESPGVKSFVRSAEIDASRWGKIQFLNIDRRRVRVRILTLANQPTAEAIADDLLEAIQRGGLDLSQCSICGRSVVVLPDGLAVCDPCMAEACSA